MSSPTPRERADAVCIALTKECVAWYDGYHATNKLSDRIAAAIRAAVAEERERCFRIAVAHQDRHPVEFAGNECCSQIAAAIREGESRRVLVLRERLLRRSESSDG